ncbi:MAG TPA: DUF2085 domain-containing protein [Anaerolineae bacterium]|nr:DUF2085 domain-containing protein [Anaerolineae bacterium]
MRPVFDRPLPLTPILRRSLLLGAALSAIALFVFAEPHDALVKADLIGFATCHRIAERSLIIAGQQLPLCARCTGIYLGALTGWLWLIARRRTRAAQLPPRPITLALIGFIVLMGVDGLNSLMMLIPGFPHLYETENWMRIFTGSLYGIALSTLLTPYITLTWWRDPTGERTLKGPGELLLLVNIAAALALAALTGASFLLWPLVIASVVGVVGLMAAMNASLVVMLAGRANTYSRWRELVTPGLIGIGLALTEFVVIDVLRAGLV